MFSPVSRTVSRGKKNSSNRTENAVTSDAEAEPNTIDALCADIDAAEAAGDMKAAETLLAEYRKRVRDDADMTARHARAIYALGEKTRATSVTRRALRMAPDDSSIRSQLADFYFDQNRYDEAETEYRRVMETEGENPIVLRRLARILQSRDHGNVEAEALLRRAVELAPDDVDALLVLGAVASNDPDRFAEAEELFLQVLEHAPESASALHNYGLLRRFQGDLETAEEYLTRACAVRDQDADFAFSLGCCFLFQERVETALEWFEKACTLNPDSNSAHVYSAYAMFLLGRMKDGWARYEKRLELDALKGVNYTRPRWDGGALNGKTLLIVPEQGMGDNLQFARYAALAAERDCQVIVATHEPLVRLFQSLVGVKLVTTRIPEPKHFHRYAPMMSLPYIFGTDTDTIPANTPYLSAPDDLVADWADKLSGYDGIKVGVNWRGNPKHVNDRFRSSSLEDMAQLADVPGVTVFAIQKGRPDHEATLPDGIVDIADDFETFTDTAAAMANLDLVISVDTSLCHLAGALGRPVWTMIARAPDFRWGLEGTESPWYPSMRLYRQETLGDWAPVYAAMRRDLEALAAAP